MKKIVLTFIDLEIIILRRMLMVINTRAFGDIEIEENKEIEFLSPLPGFPESSKYVLIYDEEDETFCWLQSLDEPHVAFAVLNTLTVLKDYNPNFPIDELGELKDTKDDLLIYNIVVIPEEIENATVNLKAPVLIDSKRRIGRQVIANNEEYSIRQQIVSKVGTGNG